MTKKIWTTKNGIVGTAHRNREEKIVDFRPASRISGDGKIMITVYPPKGQANGVEPLKLEVARIERAIEDVDLIQKGIHHVEEIGFSSFEGIEIFVTLRSYTEWYDKELEEANKVASEEQMAGMKKERDEERNFLKSISLEDMAAEVTTSELGKLRAGKTSPSFLLRELLIRIAEKRRKAQDYWLFQEELRNREKEVGYLDQLKADLLAFDDQRKKERKQEWLAKA